ncbi:hypothetical protein NHJ13734_003702 [Beauveria thailandica]
MTPSQNYTQKQCTQRVFSYSHAQQLSQQRQRRLAAKEISRRVAPVTHPAVKVQADLHAHKVKPVVNCDADNPVAGLEDIAPYLAAVGAIERLVRGRGLCGA